MKDYIEKILTQCQRRLRLQLKLQQQAFHLKIQLLHQDLPQLNHLQPESSTSSLSDLIQALLQRLNLMLSQFLQQ